MVLRGKFNAHKIESKVKISEPMHQGEMNLFWMTFSTLSEFIL